MTTDNIITLCGIIATLASLIGGAAVGLAFKNQGRISVLETNAEAQEGFVARVATLEANAENHAEMIREHRQESKDFRKALEQNTLAISELTTLIKHKL